MSCLVFCVEWWVGGCVVRFVRLVGRYIYKKGWYPRQAILLCFSRFLGTVPVLSVYGWYAAIVLYCTVPVHTVFMSVMGGYKYFGIIIFLCFLVPPSPVA